MYKSYFSLIFNSLFFGIGSGVVISFFIPHTYEYKFIEKQQIKTITEISDKNIPYSNLYIKYTNDSTINLNVYKKEKANSFFNNYFIFEEVKYIYVLNIPKNVNID